MIHRIAPSFVLRQWSGAPVDWDGATIKGSLHDDSIALDSYAALAAVDFFDDIAASELATDLGYTAGGVAIGVLSVGQDNGTRQIRLLASNSAIWNPLTVGAGQTNTAFRYLATWVDLGTPATSPLATALDFEGDQTIDGGELEVDWDPTGLIRNLLPA